MTGVKFNIEKELLRENSKARDHNIVSHIGSNGERFQELIDVFLKGDYRSTQRASWPIIYCLKKNPYLIEPHLKGIIKNLSKPNLHDAVVRNTLRLLQYCNIPNALHSLTITICIRFINNKKSAIAIKVFAMTVLSNLAAVYPELKNELRLLLEDQLRHGSAGIRSRGLKILKALQKS